MIRLDDEIFAASALITTPNAFTFTDQTGVALSSTITSAAITVSGLSTGVTAAISVSGGTYDINSSGSFTSSPGTVQNGDTVRARHTSSGSISTAVNTTVTIGAINDTFTSTTSAFSPVTNDYTAGSGTENVPAGATQVVISMNGNGGNGAANINPGPPGGGGGGGGFCQKTVAVSGGQSFSWAFSSGNTTVTSGSPSVSLAANRGADGTAGSGGNGGTASGGDTNTTGGTGSTPTGGSSPSGGAIQTTLGAAGNAPGGGGAGNTMGGGTGSGAAGRIRFAFT